MLNVTSSEQLGPVFQQPPAGMTPTTAVLQHVLKAKKQISQEKKVLIVILTDGQPTNSSGEVRASWKRCRDELRWFRVDAHVTLGVSFLCLAG